MAWLESHSALYPLRAWLRLADAGLVLVQPSGRQRLYVVDPRGLEHLERFLAELWPKGLDRLKSAVEKRAGKRSER